MQSLEFNKLGILFRRNVVKTYSVKEMIRDGKKATFVKYRNGKFIYRTECGFEFPVPENDLGESDLHAEEKAVMLMKYIKKAVKEIEEAEIV